MEYAINELLEELSSMDMSNIDGTIYIETIEMSGKHTRWSGSDLVDLIRKITFEMLGH